MLYDKYIPQDFPVGNGVNTAVLTEEISSPDSGIMIGLVGITKEGNKVSIEFRASLSSYEQDALTNICATHDGNKLPTELDGVVLTTPEGAPIGEDNPLPSADPKNPRDIWDKNMYHTTVRPPHCDTYYTGADDEGNVVEWEHKAGSGQEPPIYFDLNPAMNKTYLHNGWLMYEGCKFERASMSIVPYTTPVSPSDVGTAYKLYGGYLVIPAAGDGDCLLAGHADIPEFFPCGKDDPVNGLCVVECVVSQKTGQKYPGYWNAEWDHERLGWKNLTPAPDGSGRFNIYTFEVILDEFFNKIGLLGSGLFYTNSKDTAQIGIGMRIKCSVAMTRPDDHDWNVIVNFFLHREKTT